jgi:glutamine amidotransferase
MVGIIDYGTANVGALQNMHRRCGIPAKLVSDPAELPSVDRIILPGIGAFDNGMRQLQLRGFVPAILDAVSRNVPLLGICLGMQLLGRRSEEGEMDGLGLIEAECVRLRIPSGSGLKVPHQGWCHPEVRKDCALVSGVTHSTRYYFSHSYHMVCSEFADVVAECQYGFPFTAIVQRGLVLGVQFHPEKSHVHGMTLLMAFSAIAP